VVRFGEKAAYLVGLSAELPERGLHLMGGLLDVGQGQLVGPGSSITGPKQRYSLLHGLTS
jgi:hypothetical protein